MEVEIHCSNCGEKQKMQIVRDKGFKKCDECSVVLQYSIWKTGIHQCCANILKGKL